MCNIRIIGGWVAIFAVVAIVLAGLTLSANGPLPFIGNDGAAYLTPAWG
jgi:hypothetical protein